MSGAGEFLFIGIEGTRMTPALARLLARVQPSGVILFRRNLDSPEAAFRFVRGIRNLLGEKTFVCMDQEGGRVSRLGAFGFDFPSAHAVAATGRPVLSRRHARLTGRALRALGVNVNFAPVLDLSTPGASNGIGDRAYSDDPRAAARFGREFLHGLLREKVLGCLKHFPGLGTTTRDSHHVLPTARFRGDSPLRHAAPFRELAHSVSFVMLSHAYYPSFSRKRLPAGLDSAVTRTLLRGYAGFYGVALSDDLAMKAVPAWAREKRPDAFLAAGCDALLVCEPADVERTWKALQARLDARAVRDSVVREARARLAHARGLLAAPPRTFSTKKLDALRREVERFAARVRAFTTS